MTEGQRVEMGVARMGMAAAVREEAQVGEVEREAPAEVLAALAIVVVAVARAA